KEQHAAWVRAGWTKRPDLTLVVDFPAGCELTVDRVYVRQRADDYASVTFFIAHHPRPELIGERFWARLEQVNGLACEHVAGGQPISIAARAAYRKGLDVPSPKAAKAAKNKQELRTLRRNLLAYLLAGIAGSDVGQAFARFA